MSRRGTVRGIPLLAARGGDFLYKKTRLHDNIGENQRKTTFAKKESGNFWAQGVWPDATAWGLMGKGSDRRRMDMRRPWPNEGGHKAQNRPTLRNPWHMSTHA